MVHQVRGQPFKFLRFKSNDLKLMKTDNLDIFSIPTSQQNLVAFFIRCEGMKRELQGELKRNKTDLYNKFEDAFKNVGAAAQKPSELWVPAFQKEVACDLPWIEGYEIPPQRNETESQHIKKCRESVRIEVNAETPSAGCLVIPKQKGQILNKDFVFGLTYLNVDKTLDAPIFMCLVENGDWIAA